LLPVRVGDNQSSASVIECDPVFYFNVGEMARSFGLWQIPEKYLAGQFCIFDSNSRRQFSPMGKIGCIKTPVKSMDQCPQNRTKQPFSFSLSFLEKRDTLCFLCFIEYY